MHAGTQQSCSRQLRALFLCFSVSAEVAACPLLLLCHSVRQLEGAARELTNSAL
jgi:hypothetical protein